MAYDYLLLALGSETNYFGMTQVANRAATLKTLGDAALLRNRMVALLEDAATQPDESARRRLMTFVVAGGGFAGVETVGAMNDFLRETLKHYPELDPPMLRVVLVHAGDVVLPELGEHLGRYAQEKLRCRGVELRLGARVGGYDDGIVKLSTGDPIPANALVWTAGVTPAPAVAALAVEKINGRLKVNQCLELAGYQGVVWAVGDSAAVPDGRGGLHPPTAQHGLREGLAAAKNIAAAIDGADPKPFRFSTIGQLASIGHHTGVAQILGMRFSGFTAWWLWRSVYLAKLPGFAKKVRVAIQWTLDLLFSRQIEQFLTLKDLEQIEHLAAQVRASRSELITREIHLA
jgi:NADH dehydrogenase